MLVDAHCHLQDIPEESLATNLADAARQAVTGWVCCGTSPDDWHDVRSISSQHTSILPAYGLHPWHLQRTGQAWKDMLAQQLADCELASVGEVGLDRAKGMPDLDLQVAALIYQIELAHRYHRPFILHCHNAWGRLGDVLASTAPHPRGFLIHSFSGSPEIMQELACLGGYFSFSPALCNPRYKHMRTALQSVPIERFLLETDAPSYPLEALYSGHLTAAGLRRIKPDSLALQIARNYQRLFLTSPDQSCAAWHGCDPASCRSSHQ